MEELDQRAADLASRLPNDLAPLTRVAYNYRWRWHPDGKEVFRAIDSERWELCGENPVRLLQEVSAQALARAAGDPDLLARITGLYDAIDADLRRPSEGPVAPERPVAFFCAEFGVHRSLPILFGRPGWVGGRLPEGGVGPCGAPGRGRPDVSAGVLPPAARGVRVAA